MPTVVSWPSPVGSPRRGIEMSEMPSSFLFLALRGGWTCSGSSAFIEKRAKDGIAIAIAIATDMGTLTYCTSC